jgi:hypothetical protein
MTGRVRFSSPTSEAKPQVSLGFDNQVREVNGVARETGDLVEGDSGHEPVLTFCLDEATGDRLVGVRNECRTLVASGALLACLHVFPLSRDNEHALPLGRRGYLAHQRGGSRAAFRNMVGDINSHGDLLLTVRQAAIRLGWVG